ncbi:MAG: HAMP domain-containing sensor histidine kinase [Clostridium sp.]|nr:HAMP domain-containing sensor histidine kinase [Clostridium sp.]
MSFFKYLKESYKFIIFYIALMLFIFMVSYLDRKNRMLSSDIVYIAVVSFFIFIVFLLWDYNEKYRYIKTIMQLKNSKDKTPILPPPKEYKDEVYAALIQDLYNSYTTDLRNIEDKFKENNEFMTAWVHEIKTPITTSKLIIDGLEVSNSELAASMEEEIDKIDNYVEKVLYYSRSDDFSKDYIVSEVSINKLIKDSVKKHSIIFIRKHIKFINKVDEKNFVDTDKKWLEFILDQIVSNALKYTESNGTIKFSTTEDDNEKILTIEDNGVGIKSEDAQRVFVKSFTGNNGRNVNMKSTGMGLYLSQKLAKKLGHYITLKSEYGQGTSVYIHFPKWNDYYNVTKM